MKLSYSRERRHHVNVRWIHIDLIPDNEPHLWFYPRAITIRAREVVYTALACL